MRLLRHPVAALVLFTFLTGLMLGFYNELQEGYGFTPTDYKVVDGENQTIMSRLNDMNLISGISDLKIGILKINPPTGSNVGFDILGGLASVGIGAIKTVVGIVSTPFEFLAIVLEYYAELPPSIKTELGLFVVVYVGFILTSIYVKGEV